MRIREPYGCLLGFVLIFTLGVGFARADFMSVIGQDGRDYTVIDNVYGGSSTGDYTEAGMRGTSGSGWCGDSRYGDAGTGTCATWTFDFASMSLSNGDYDVYATWVVNGGFPETTQAQYSISDDGSSGTLDQLAGPWSMAGNILLNDGTAAGNFYFAPLGSVTVADGNLSVTFTGSDSQFVCADAVAIAMVPEPSTLVFVLSLFIALALARVKR